MFEADLGGELFGIVRAVAREAGDLFRESCGGFPLLRGFQELDAEESSFRKPQVIGRRLRWCLVGETQHVVAGFQCFRAVLGIVQSGGEREASPRTPEKRQGVVVLEKGPQQFLGLGERLRFLLADEDRVLGHYLAARYLESVGEREAVLLAEHYRLGGAVSEATHWYRLAAEQALEASELGTAQKRAQAALDGGATGVERGLLLLLQANAAYWLRTYEETRRAASCFVVKKRR